ncbi:MAG: tetratricopeptide repeat protein, partial [bacterium]|nr:tetratricopeptide repeat protein [bacterium]
MAIDAEKKISLLSRFFSNKKGKYVFLVCDDERVVRQVQFQLYLQLVLNKNKILHHLALSEDNPSVYSQVKDSQERELYDGLIVSNLNLLIYRYAEKIINELNVSRDALAEFGIPIVFIVNNENLKKITSRASDLYQMREMSDFHFESGNIREWDNAKSRVASSFEYTLPELKLELLEEQVDALSEKKQLSPDEISAYVIPLLSLYLDKFEIDKAENLYKSHIHGDIDKTGSFKDFETIGRYYREQNSYKEALIYFNKALGVASDDIYVAKTYLNLGIVY